MARWLLQDIITEEEAEQLIAEKSAPTFKHPIVRRIVSAFKRDIDPEIQGDSPGYVRVEHKPEGHQEHNDRGHRRHRDSGHMEWCEYGASILLTDPSKFSGVASYTPTLRLAPCQQKSTI